MIIVRFAEIGLKGKNRSFFEKALIRNIKICLDAHKIKYSDITKPHGRVLIATADPCHCLKNVFGIASFSDAINAGFDIESAKKQALKLAKDLNPEKTFRVTCQRLDKNFPVTSKDFQIDVGGFIQEKTKAKAKMKGFDLNIQAEIIDNFIYLFTEKIPGQGGLPVGVEGTVIVLLETESSLLAGLLMMKRGCKIIPAAFKTTDIELLKSYAYGTRIELKIIKDVSELDNLAKQSKAKAVIVGDLLENIQEYNIQAQVLRPMVAYTEKKIEEELDDFRQRVC
jgi:thiamine biosynthesis protein ThiI